MADNKKVVFAYTVMRNEDGSVDVKSAGIEGVEEISNARIYEDIEDVAEMIKIKRYADAAAAASYSATAKFYQDMQAAQQAARTAQPAPTVNEKKKS
jgi:hypothetical protein